jgi:Tol biopolymer transport system component
MPPSGGRRAVPRLAPRLVVLLVVLAALVLVGVSRKGVKQPYSDDISTLRDFRLTRLTETGQITGAAVAPDGRYIAYVASDGDRSSLWIGQTATKGRAQVLQSRAVRLANVAFSPDGNYLYFTLARNSGFSDLYRVPTLGGAARLLVHDVDTPVTFSPDQKSIAFMRGAPQRGEFYLVRADADGGSEKVLATQRRPIEFEFAGPAWSPDGKLIATVIQDYTTQRRWAVDLISAEDGAVREIFETPHMLGRLRWTPDGKALLTVISDSPASAGALRGVQQQGGQIWRISYPTGEARQLSNDLANYDPCCLDITADGKTLTAVQNTMIASIWVAPAQTPEQVTRITSGPPVVGKHTWLRDSTTILYRDIKGNLYRVARNGGGLTLLTPTGHTVISAPSACGDGRYVVFQSVPESGSFGIWRMEVDGTNPVQLHEAKPDTEPQCSVDGKWVYFTRGPLRELYAVSPPD